MDGYAVARVDEIGEMERRPRANARVRHHFGITSFGVNVWTASEAGARIINEHDESEPDSQEELYLVLRGRASFEVDGEQVDAPAGTFRLCTAGRQTAQRSGRSTARQSLRSVVSRKAVRAWGLGAVCAAAAALPRRVIMPRRRIADASCLAGRSTVRRPVLQRRLLAKASRPGTTRPSRIFDARFELSDRSRAFSKAIPTSIRSAKTPPSRNCSRGEVPPSCHVRWPHRGSHAEGGRRRGSSDSPAPRRTAASVTPCDPSAHGRPGSAGNAHWPCDGSEASRARRALRTRKGASDPAVGSALLAVRAGSRRHARCVARAGQSGPHGTGLAVRQFQAGRA